MRGADRRRLGARVLSARGRKSRGSRSLLMGKAGFEEGRSPLAIGGALLWLVLALSLSGCAYELGSANGLAEHGRSLQVRPFLNRTVEPRLTDAVTDELRRAIQRDGTFKLATHEDGDLVASGVITAYGRQELTFKPSDVLTVSDYRLALTAHVTVRDRTSGKVVLDRPVTGYTLIRVGYDLASSERQAMPLLAADLSRNVVALLVEGSW